MESTEKITENSQNNIPFDLEMTALIGSNTPYPSRREQETFDRWKREYGEDLVRYACQLTNQMQSGKLFKYTEAVLKNWEKAGVETVQQAKAETKKFRSSSAASKEKKKISNEMQRTVDEAIALEQRRAVYLLLSEGVEKERVKKYYPKQFTAGYEEYKKHIKKEQ